MDNINAMDALVSDFGWEKLREAYVWEYPSRETSEREISRLEDLVRNNILRHGVKSHKNVLLEIRRWKTGRRHELDFLKNPDSSIEIKVNEVLQLINLNSAEPSHCISVFCELKGVQVAVASAFLRFLDPDKHRFGIIDKYVARFCNDHNLTHFKLRKSDDYVERSNQKEYSVFCHCLHQIAGKLREKGVKFNTIDGNAHDFDAVDVEMAIFMYQRKGATA